MSLKGEMGDFFSLISSLRRELSSVCTREWPGREDEQITCNTSGAYHVQHIVSHVEPRDSTAVKVRADIAFILTLFPWLKLLTNEGEGETGVARKKTRGRASENVTY